MQANEKYGRNGNRCTVNNQAKYEEEIDLAVSEGRVVA